MIIIFTQIKKLKYEINYYVIGPKQLFYDVKKEIMFTSRSHIILKEFLKIKIYKNNKLNVIDKN